MHSQVQPLGARAELLLQTLMLTLHHCKSSSPVGIETQLQEVFETAPRPGQPGLETILKLLSKRTTERQGFGRHMGRVTTPDAESASRTD